jgi:hypothetical protein
MAKISEHLFRIHQQQLTRKKKKKKGDRELASLLSRTSLSDTSSTADTEEDEKEGRELASLLSRKRQDQDAAALKEVGLVSDPFPWKFVSAEDGWPRFDFRLSWKIGGAAEQEKGRNLEHLCNNDEGEEFLGLLVSLEEYFSELKNMNL